MDEGVVEITYNTIQLMPMMPILPLNSREKLRED